MDRIVGGLAFLMLIAGQFTAVVAVRWRTPGAFDEARPARLAYLLAGLLGLGAAATIAGAARAQDGYPDRTVKLVVPTPPGSTLDTLPRIIADKLSQRWKETVIVENKPGAAQNLGAEYVAKSEPDGYTLLATPQGPLTISQYFFPKLGFDPTAFVPISMFAQQPLLLVANPRVPAASLRELIAYAKANPGKINFASPGVGSSPHLTGEMLQGDAGIRFTHVPYKGMTPLVTDLIAGRVDIAFNNLSNTLELIREGKLKALAVASEKRIPEFPDVPAVAELYPGFYATSWFALVAPPRTSAAIAEKIWRDLAQVLRQPDVAERFKQLGVTPTGLSPAQTATFLKEEAARWQRVIAGSHIGPM
jgi:tripartite-type tricarboxylate transporter receptor subunit TctC